MSKIYNLYIISFFLLIGNQAFSQLLKINEILASNNAGIIDEYGERSDWIEIYNSGNEPINLQGFFLSDNPEKPLKWVFPNVSIQGQSFLLVFASEKNSTTSELHANFKISMDGEPISLYNTSGVLIDRFDSVQLKPDVSYGRGLTQSNIRYFFTTPTPYLANNTTSYSGILSEPSLSHESGFYADPINVSASHNESDVIIRYTLDASEPTASSAILNGNVYFQNVENQPNIVSNIPTNPGFNYPVPDYDEDRANSRGWLPPEGLVNKNNVIKIKAFKNTYLPSETVTNSYFINPDTSGQYSIPVISLITEPDFFFSNDLGIYVYGTTGPEGNYNMSGREWERETFVQYFDNNGILGFEQSLGARIHGGGGRNSAVKNLRMYARNEYGKDEVTYKFFSNSDHNKFKRFMIRGPGHRPDCTPRDDLADLLLQNLNMDIQHVQPITLFVNGEYWGLHSIKERFDQDYLALKYGKKDDDYVILRNSGILDSGEEGDELPYLDLIDYVQTHDMSTEESYNHVKEQLDIDNYLSYFACEVYMGNVDWINTNIKFYRYKGANKNPISGNALDGKWRWFMYDFDLVFGGSCHNITPNVNILEDAFDPEMGNSTKLAIGLKQNEQFGFDLVNRICDHMNSNFKEKNFIEKVQQIDETMTPEMQKHVERWHYPSTSETLEERALETPSLTQWNMILDQLYNYPSDRKRKMIDHMKAEFNLADSIHIELDVNDTQMGNLKMNSLFISEALDGVSESVYPWHGTYFQDVPFTLIAVPKLGYRFVEWEETGDTIDTLNMDINYGIKLTALFEKDPDFVFDDALYINEFMASNSSIIEDEYNANADWIEIFNPNNKAVDLASFFISDDKQDGFKYQFPRGDQSTIIPPFGFKIIWCNDRPERGPLQTNFKLSADGEDIVLLAPDSSLIDELSYAVQQEDVSYGREKDGETTWKFFQNPVGPTPGATNNNASIDELFKEQITFFPNPVKRGEQIHFNTNMSLEVYNLWGQLVKQIIDVNKMDTDDLSTGIYLLKSKGSSNSKLMVQ